jgi:cytochrome c-type biogenesis protein
VNELVLAGPLVLATAVAALAGLVSFASPCVLPLVPGFLGYLGGMTSEQVGRRRLLLGALLFVLGFTAVFLSMSVVISGVGLALTEHQGVLLQVAGVVVLLLGLVMLVQPGASWQPRWRPAAGLAGAPLLGVAFGLGFTACTGPALVAIQVLGTSILPGEQQVGRALLLGTAYSLGLGVPFLLAAAGMGWATRASRRLRDHYPLIQRVGGSTLVVLGLLMLTGVWEQVAAAVQTRLLAGFETVI